MNTKRIERVIEESFATLEATFEGLLSVANNASSTHRAAMHRRVVLLDDAIKVMRSLAVERAALLAERERGVVVATVGRHWECAVGFDLNDFAEPLPAYGTKLYASPTPPAPAEEG
jgi:hypothetical protein